MRYPGGVDAVNLLFSRFPGVDQRVQIPSTPLCHKEGPTCGRIPCEISKAKALDAFAESDAATCASAHVGTCLVTGGFFAVWISSFYFVLNPFKPFVERLCPKLRFITV